MDNLETQTGINKWFIFALGIIVFIIVLLLSSLRANVTSQIDGISTNPIVNQDVQIQAGPGLNGGTITNTGTISLDAPICNQASDKLQWDGSTFICIDEVLNPTTPTTTNTDNQTLFYNAGNLTISNGNTVNIPLGGTAGVTSITAGAGLNGGVITSTGTVSLNAPTCAFGETLTWNGAALSCISTAGGGTLDDAYDFGGPGAGRIVITDAGPVEFIDTKTGGFAGYDPSFVMTGDGTPNNSSISGIAMAKMDTQGGDDGSILLFATDVHDFTNGYYAFNSFSALPAAEFYQIGFSDGATRYANIMMMNGLMQIQSENGSGMDIQSDQDLFITSVNDTVRIRGQAQANSGGTQITNQNGAAAAYVLTLNPALSGGINQLVGTGDPEGVWASDSGSVFFRTDGTGGAEQLYVKTTDGANTGWVALGGASAGGGTLDDAYDFGGPGAGRTIFTDSGSVELVDSVGAVPFGFDPAFTVIGDGVGTNTAGAGIGIGRLDFGPFTGTGSIYSVDVNNFSAGVFGYEIYADAPGNEFYNIGLSNGGGGDFGTLSFDTFGTGLSSMVGQLTLSGVSSGPLSQAVFIANNAPDNSVVTLGNSFGSSTQFVGQGDPNNVVDGFMGSIYFDTSGSGQPPIWAKETGSGTNTGWVQLATGGPGGGTLQDAYNFGGPAAGNDLEVDVAALRLGETNLFGLNSAGAFSSAFMHTHSSGTNNAFIIRDDQDGARLTFASELFNSGANYYDMFFQGTLDNFALINGLSGAGWTMTNQGNNFSYGSTAGVNDAIMQITNGAQNQNAFLRFNNNNGTTEVFSGGGSPENSVFAYSGSTYHRTDGIGASEQLYIKTTGIGFNTGWVALGGGGGGGGTLDDAYDFGGPGSGRIITVDAGAVEINGVNEALFISTQNIVGNQAIVQGYNANGSGFEMLTSPNGGGIRFLDMPNLNFANLTYEGAIDEVLLTNDTGTIFRQQGVLTSVMGTNAGSQVMDIINTAGPGTLRLTGTGANSIDQMVGLGDPEGSHFANSGSIFFRTDGVGANQQLYIKTTDASVNGWVALGGGGGGTLDDAYDFGGPGFGRLINVTDGAVRLATPDGLHLALQIDDATTSAGLEFWNDTGRNIINILGSLNNELNSTGDLYLNTTAGSLFTTSRDYMSFVTQNNDIIVDSAGSLTLGADSSIITLFTNSLERMRVANNGNVGIGTNNPLHPLAVHTDVNGQGIMELRNNNAGASASSHLAFGNNNAWIGNIQVNSTTNGSLGGFESFNLNTTATYNLTLGTNNNVRMFVSGTTGNIGVGSTNPLNKFVVQDNIVGPVWAEVANLDNGVTSSAGILFRNDIGNQGYMRINSSLNGAEGGTNTLNVNTGAGIALVLGTNGSNRISIFPTGEVGINSVTPTEALSVGQSFEGTQRIEINSAQRSELVFSETAVNLWGVGRISPSVGVFSIHDYSAGEDLISAYQGGNLGIRNDSPTSLLHVGSAAWNDNVVGTFQNFLGTCTIDPDGSLGTFACTSDSRLKEDVADYSAGALDLISQLRVRNYSMINDPTNELKTGFIAQEVQSVIPELVQAGPDGYLKLSVTGFTPYLVKAIQELNQDNLKIKQDIENLKAQLDGTDVSELQTIASDLNTSLTNIKNDIDSLATNSFDITAINQRILDLETLIQSIPVALSGIGTVSAGNNSVRIKFATPLTKIPSVTITPVGINAVYYGVENIDQNGFDIVVEPISLSDILFNWIAL